MAIWLRQRPFIKCGCSILSCEPTRPEPSSAARTSGRGRKRRHMFSAHRNACLMRATNRTVQRGVSYVNRRKNGKKITSQRGRPRRQTRIPIEFIRSLIGINKDSSAVKYPSSIFRQHACKSHGSLHEQHLPFLYRQFSADSRGCGGLEK